MEINHRQKMFRQIYRSIFFSRKLPRPNNYLQTMMAAGFSDYTIDAPRTFSNGVLVRNMTYGDCEFVGQLLVQSFESKFELAVGRNNLSKVSQATAEQYRQLAYRYNRIFIAEVEGKHAGLLELRFFGERTDGGEDAFEEHLGIWPLCRLACLDWAMEEGLIPKEKCYVDHIAVCETMRGKGIGKSLLQVANDEALKNSCKSLYLWVADDNRAKFLYERDGYSVVNSTGNFIVKYLTGRNRFLKMEKWL